MFAGTTKHSNIYILARCIHFVHIYFLYNYLFEFYPIKCLSTHKNILRCSVKLCVCYELCYSIYQNVLFRLSIYSYLLTSFFFFNGFAVSTCAILLVHNVTIAWFLLKYKIQTVRPNFFGPIPYIHLHLHLLGECLVFPLEVSA